MIRMVTPLMNDSGRLFRLLSSAESFGRPAVYAAFQELLVSPEDQVQRFADLMLALEQLVLTKYNQGDYEAMSLFMMLQSTAELRAKEALNSEEYHRFCNQVSASCKFSPWWL